MALGEARKRKSFPQTYTTRGQGEGGVGVHWCQRSH
jgi:hypothetical protein